MASIDDELEGLDLDDLEEELDEGGMSFDEQMDMDESEESESEEGESEDEVEEDIEIEPISEGISGKSGSGTASAEAKKSGGMDVKQMAILGAGGLFLVGMLGYGATQFLGLGGGAAPAPEMPPMMNNKQSAPPQAQAPKAPVVGQSQMSNQPPRISLNPQAQQPASSVPALNAQSGMGVASQTKTEQPRITMTPEPAVQKPAGAVAQVSAEMESEIISRLDSLETGIGEVKGKVNSLDKRMGAVEATVAEHENLIAVQTGTMQRVASRVEDIFERMEMLMEKGVPVKTVSAPEIERMKGYQVIQTSDDNTMSIIKTPTGRVIVLFEGERLRYMGKTYTVSSVENEGKLVKVGDKYFIDDVYEKPEAVSAASKPKAESKPQKRYVSGWSVVSYGNGTGVIRSSSGQFHSFVRGGSVEGLGRIKSVSPAGEVTLADGRTVRVDRP